MEVTTMTTQCKICGKDYKRIDTHVKQSHKEINKEAYDKLDDYVEEIKIEPNQKLSEKEAEAILKGQQRLDNIFADSITDPDNPEEMPISTILEEFDITYKELRATLKTYTKGSPMDVTQGIERNMKLGVEGADELKDQDEVSTTNLNIAEELTKAHGFVVIEVTGNPKTWVLHKQ